MDKEGKLVKDKNGNPIKAKDMPFEIIDGKKVFLDENGRPVDY